MARQPIQRERVQLLVPRGREDAAVGHDRRAVEVAGRRRRCPRAACRHRRRTPAAAFPIRRRAAPRRSPLRASSARWGRFPNGCCHASRSRQREPSRSATSPCCVAPCRAVRHVQRATGARPRVGTERAERLLAAHLDPLLRAAPDAVAVVQEDLPVLVHHRELRRAAASAEEDRRAAEVVVVHLRQPRVVRLADAKPRAEPDEVLGVAVVLGPRVLGVGGRDVDVAVARVGNRRLPSPRSRRPWRGRPGTSGRAPFRCGDRARRAGRGRTRCRNGWRSPRTAGPARGSAPPRRAPPCRPPAPASRCRLRPVARSNAQTRPSPPATQIVPLRRSRTGVAEMPWIPSGTSLQIVSTAVTVRVQSGVPVAASNAAKVPPSLPA